MTSGPNGSATTEQTYLGSGRRKAVHPLSSGMPSAPSPIRGPRGATEATYTRRSDRRPSNRDGGGRAE